MSTFESRTYIPSSETDERFIPHFSEEKRKLLDHYRITYPDILNKLTNDDYSFKFSTQSLSTNFQADSNDSSSFTMDDSSMPPMEAKEHLSRFITSAFKNILSDVCMLDGDFRKTLIAINDNETYPQFIKWSTVAQITLTKFDNLVQKVGINSKHPKIEYVRKGLYNLVVQLCAHYNNGMDIGLKINHTNIWMWKQRKDFDESWEKATYDKDTIIRMQKLLDDMHNDDRQRTITNIRNALDSYLEYMWVYVAQKSNTTMENPQNDEKVNNITTGVEQVDLNTA